MHTPNSTQHLSYASDSSPDLPPPPNPAEDASLAIRSPEYSDGQVSPPIGGLDIYTLPPTTALKLLCAGIEALVRITGDVPPTPPLSYPTIPNMLGMQAEKDSIARSPSYSSLQMWKDKRRTTSGSSVSSDDIDGVQFRRHPVGSPDHQPTDPYLVIGANAEPLNLQHSAITRKFYSKSPPPISLEDYLMRIQTFCPMSTAVYLATSIYIHRLAVEERAIPVTRRNSHRLILAGLRVAMKALEDLSYPHRRFAKVGGVSENELARLEVSFCFLTGFDLRTSQEQLIHHATNLKEISAAQGSVGGYKMSLKAPVKNRRRFDEHASTPIATDA